MSKREENQMPNSFMRGIFKMPGALLVQHSADDHTGDPGDMNA